MQQTFKVLAAVLLSAAMTFLGTLGAGAQPLPPHPPGSICGTPQFWCWAASYGVPGTQCVCPTASGAVYGVYM